MTPKYLIPSLLLLTFSFAQGQNDKLEFNSSWSYWDNEGKKISKEPAQYKKFNSIELSNNEIALFEGKSVEDFRIEMDIAGGGSAGIGFRGKDFLNYEYVYFRISSGGTSAAIQYVPVYNGSTGWMLYPPSRYGGTANYYEEEWFHVALEVNGKSVKVFVNNAASPNLEVKLLHTDLSKGNIFLKSESAPCYFANVKMKSQSGTKSAESKKTTSSQFLNAWSVSEPFTLNEPFAFWAYPRIESQLKGWQPVQADENGIVNLSKYFSLPQQSVCSKITLNTTDSVTKQLLFDYTYSLMIVLNSKVIFYGKEVDNFGLVNDAEQKIELPLKKGDNELRFYITGDAELYNGEKKYQGRTQAFNWGFIARLNDYSGITPK